MKKGFIIISIGLWTIVVVAIIALAISISRGRFNKMSVVSVPSELLKEEEVLLGDCDKITINTTRHSIQLFKSTGDKIKISQYGNPDTSQDELFKVSTSGNSIHIYIDRKVRLEFFNFIGEEKLLIEIPESFYGDMDVAASSGSIRFEDEFALKDVKLNTSSGSARFNDNILADTLNIKSSSGSIRLNGTVTAKKLTAKVSSGSIHSAMDIKVDGDIELNSTSGSIDLDKNVTARSLYADTSSGGIRLENVYVEAFDLNCTSGSVKVNKISGGGNIRSSSGSINIALENPEGDIYLKTNSGSIKVGLEPTLQFKLTAQTISGSIKTNFPTDKNDKGNHATANIGDNPSVNIIARASSGGIRIQN